MLTNFHIIWLHHVGTELMISMEEKKVSIDKAGSFWEP